MLIRIILVFFLLFSIVIANAFANPFPTSKKVPNYKPLYGTSFSFEQAGWYGQDPRGSFVKLLDLAHFDWVRLPFFWDQMTEENGKLKVENLKFAVEEAKKRDVKVIIALGLKTPYYPEYHLPKTQRDKLTIGQTIKASDSIAADLLAVDKKLVSELSVYDNISYWQVENEPFLPNVNGWKIDSDLLQKEIKLVRETDPKHRPIILNSVGPAVFDKSYRKILDLLAPGDVFGVNVYFKTQGTNLVSVSLFGHQINVFWPKWFSWPVQSWVFFSPNFESIRKEAEKRGVDLWVLEMQAEPYIRTLSDARSGKFNFRPEDIKKADSYLKSSEVKSVGFWGANFWMFKKNAGDHSWIGAVQSLVNPY